MYKINFPKIKMKLYILNFEIQEQVDTFFRYTLSYLLEVDYHTLPNANSENMAYLYIQSYFIYSIQ